MNFEAIWRPPVPRWRVSSIRLCANTAGFFLSLLLLLILQLLLRSLYTTHDPSDHSLFIVLRRSVFESQLLPVSIIHWSGSRNSASPLIAQPSGIIQQHHSFQEGDDIPANHCDSIICDYSQPTEVNFDRFLITLRSIEETHSFKSTAFFDSLLSRRK